MFEAWEREGLIEGAMKIDRLSKYRDEIIEIAKRYGASNIRVFGSVARGDADRKAISIFSSILKKGGAYSTSVVYSSILNGSWAAGSML